MKVHSKLANLEFRFGEFEYRKDHLIIHSAPEQSMQIRVYVSPDDVVSALKKALFNPQVWMYCVGLPFFLLRYRRRHRARARGQDGN